MNNEKLDFFLNYLNIWNQEEKNKYLKIFNNNSINGIAINPHLISMDNFMSLFPLVKKHPIVENSFIFDKEIYAFGKHPYFYTGLYYIQEPSAALPIHFLDIQGDEKILDLCASPGGKSSQILNRLNDKGFLVANEINYSRALTLSENLSKLGNINCLVLNETSEILAKRFKNYFDKVVLDAPCSLEGTFRKNSEALESWNIGKIISSANIQKELIVNAYHCLKEGGELLYSTCTFSYEENEDIVNYLLSNYHCELIDLKHYQGINRGINQSESVRVYPFNFEGEGHFIAKIRKLDQGESSKFKSLKGNMKGLELNEVKKFLNDNVKISFSNQLYRLNNDIYLLPEINLNIDELKIIQLGIKVGYYNNKHFIPSNHLSHYLPLDEFRQVLNLSSNENWILQYLKGDTITTNLNIGYVVIAVDGYALGWGKAVNGVIKNYFPKYLRVSL